MADATLTTTAINIFAAPQEAFRTIREKPRPWFPLALILPALVLVMGLYFNMVDLGWFLEAQLRSLPPEQALTDAEMAQALEGVERTRGVVATVAAVGAAIFATVLYFVMSLYLWIASSVAKHGIRFIQAFALVCWCALPSLLGAIAGLANLLISDVTFLPQHLVNPLSFGSLLGVEPIPGDRGRQTLAGLDLTVVWTLVLLVLGYQSWSGKSLGIAAAIVLAPYVVLFGLILF